MYELPPKYTLVRMNSQVAIRNLDIFLCDHSVYRDNIGHISEAIIRKRTDNTMDRHKKKKAKTKTSNGPQNTVQKTK